MFFYLLFNTVWLDLLSSKKLGITGNPLSRYTTYATRDPREKFYYVAKFPANTTREQLRQIEKNILAATKEYRIEDSAITHESRININHVGLWAICKGYFPPGTEILT